MDQGSPSPKRGGIIRQEASQQGKGTGNVSILQELRQTKGEGGSLPASERACISKKNVELILLGSATGKLRVNRRSGWTSWMGLRTERGEYS